MNGLEISELKLSEVLHDNEDFRTDSEYFSKSNLEKLAVLESKGFDYVGDFAFVTDGIHESIDFCLESNINLISAKSPKENYFDLSSNYHILKEQHEKNTRTALKVGDVIVSSVGTIGNCAVVDETILPANSDRHVGIIRTNESYLSHFLSTFLLGKYGRFQTLRESTGNVQLNLFIYRIRKLKIAKLSFEFQMRIEELVKAAHEKLEQSKRLYAEAESLLLGELGLRDWQPTNENVAVKSFKESFLFSGRLDAEFFQLKYDELDKILKTHESTNLRSLISNYSTGFPFDSGSYVKNGISLIRINNIKRGELDLSNVATIPIEDSKLSPKDVVKENDLLLSMSGTVGNCCKVPKGTKAIINQRILRFSVENFNEDALALIINSPIVRMQLERIGTGAVQTNISSGDIFKLQIPLLDKTFQQQISNMIQECFTFKDESKRLLELAKRGVELAIEQDEQAALELIGEKAANL